jgi:hypothetical protein
VFQSYAGYTPGLDVLDANALRSSRAPQRILLNTVGGIDTRLWSWDDPLTTVTMLCRYSEIHTTPTWDVLALGPNRCGPKRMIADVRANWGQTITAPPPPSPDSIVVMSVSGITPHGLESLRGLLYRPFNRYVVLNGAAHRLIAANAADGVILEAPPTLDLTGPFALAPNASSVAVTREGSPPAGGQPVRYRFFAITMAPGPRAAAVPAPVRGRPAPPGAAVSSPRARKR